MHAHLDAIVEEVGLDVCVDLEAALPLAWAAVEDEDRLRAGVADAARRLLQTGR